MTTENKARFRTPLGIAIIVYKAGSGVAELVVGTLLLIPNVDIAAVFRRLSAEELREDPTDRLVSLVTRHLPSLLEHRGLVASGVIVFGIAKLIAAGAMWNGKEWGRYLLAVMVVLLLPLDIYSAINSPSTLRMVLVLLNVVVAYLLLRPINREAHLVRSSPLPTTDNRSSEPP